MSAIKLKTEDQQLRFLSLPKITAGNKNVDSLHITLDNSWQYDGLTIDVLIRNRNEKYLLNTTLDNGSYISNIPEEFTSKPGRIYVGLVGKSNGTIIKTTNELVIFVNRGVIFESISEYKDYAGFVSDLIKELNDKFNVGLSPNTSFEDILSSIENIDYDPNIKPFFIDLLNHYLGTDLNYGSTNEEIISAVSIIANEFSELARMVKETFDTYITDVDDSEVDPKYLAHMMGIDDFCQTVINKLIDLYGRI